ncbi:MAG: 3-phosphoshikimate 1-carboxyvinyltransferase [Bacteroidales bacterium]|nr:3-phosphoshikimate 1-carboxyvinyltransferase [Bacteroidales bacterium]
MNNLLIKSLSDKIRARPALPASKSISNRVLIIRFLSGAHISLSNLSDSDDTQLLIRLLERIRSTSDTKKVLELNCDNAGTVLRFLAALLSAKPGKWLLTGCDRMLERPIAPLVAALKSLGAKIIWKGEKGFPPIEISGKKLKGGKIKVDATQSSQFITALMLIAPQLDETLTVDLQGQVGSMPYITMTAGLLEHFGVSVNIDNQVIQIKPGPYSENELHIESDWSSASFWYEMAALSRDSDIFLKGLSEVSLQGDSILPEIFTSFGVKTVAEEKGIHLLNTGEIAKKFIFNFANHPDLALPVIVTCAALGVEGIFSGLHNLRLKESDRLAAIYSELSNAGYSLEISDSVLKLSGKAGSNEDQESPDERRNDVSILHFKTYQDHRMAMALAPLALLGKPVVLDSPDVVGKSYPAFWDHLLQTGCFAIERNFKSV